MEGLPLLRFRYEAGAGFPSQSHIAPFTGVLPRDAHRYSTYSKLLMLWHLNQSTGHADRNNVGGEIGRRVKIKRKTPLEGI